MGPDSPINIWSLTVLNFSFSLIVILMLEIFARLETVKYLSKYIYKGPDRAIMKISSGIQDKIKIVALLVQQKLTGKSLNSICMESHQ